MFTGGYPSELELYRDVKTGFENANGLMYAYMGSMAALFALGVAY